MVRHALQFDSALGQLDCARTGFVDQRYRLGNRFHPFGHNAQGLHQICGRPHDPISHVVQPQHQRRGCRNRTNRCLALVPKQHRKTSDRDDQKSVQHCQRKIHFGDNSHFKHERLPRRFDLFLCVSQLTVMVRKQLDRMDIGISIHHPASNCRPGIG